MHTITTPEEMFELGKKLAKEHKILLLHGELGAGKTLLTKGFAAGLKIDHDKVQSPTYAYLHVYENKLLHLDMYRLETHTDLIEKWIHEQLQSYTYIAIEWPKFLDHFPFSNYTEVHIQKTPKGRSVQLTVKN